MSRTRRQALDAAVTLIGTEGIRALTHGRVDAAASLPPGSTSNHFRTRAALIAGVIEWMARQERSDAGTPEITSRDDLVGALTRMIALQSGPLAGRTRARYALFLEADEDATAPLREQRIGMEMWIRSILLTLGGETAARRAPFLMAAGEGLLLHRITVDPEAPIEDVIARAVDATLTG
ncbi:TetR family transcriptional regulator [Microbacterium bovistercoris]|uniref:TetR family transcriptional regulator n=1 Tax=Microbacterium bovistercoris TaxID=2293570 RepID=A0A371NUF9_9MICO|nr:TetR family transcriptional regulator [Microbacterium bovistercoris]REJ05967.1 TetR family transcriptional regulator [Microbacterium bovistercoris]